MRAGASRVDQYERNQEALRESQSCEGGRVLSERVLLSLPLVPSLGSASSRSLPMACSRCSIPRLTLLVSRRALPAVRLPSERRRLSTTAPGTASDAPSPPFRVLLLGSDDFSCATLKALHEAREGRLFRPVESSED